MFISELFTSIQGEGKYTGTQSIFIRTSYCNLRCSWCDTPYTNWDPEKKEVSLENIISYVDQVPHISPVVITGGEPFLQKEITTLCDYLQHKYITIETNATIYIPTKAHFISMSPKLASSVPRGTRFDNMHERKRIQLEVIKQFMQNHDYQLKFVVCGEGDIGEILFIQDSIQVPSNMICLMPEGKTNEELQKTAPITAMLAQRYGFNYTDRLHIRLWGERRGV